jgi:hypothetical protein
MSGIVLVCFVLSILATIVFFVVSACAYIITGFPDGNEKPFLVAVICNLLAIFMLLLSVWFYVSTFYQPIG